MGAGVPLTSQLDEDQISEVSPIIERYNILMKCKNLGIAVNANTMTPEELDLVHEFYSCIESVRANKKG